MAIAETIYNFLYWFIYDTGFGGLVVGAVLYLLFFHKTVMKQVRKRKAKSKSQKTAQGSNGSEGAEDETYEMHGQ